MSDKVNRAGRLAGRAAAWALVMSVGLASSAWAQTGSTQPGAAPPLKGPTVKDRRVPGVQPSFAPGGGGDRRMMGERLPPNIFHDALASVLGPDAPAGVKASPQQEETIKAMVSEFEQQTRAYMQEHRTEVQSLRMQAGMPARPGSGPGGNGPGGPGAPAAGRPGERGGDAMAEPTPEQQKTTEKSRARLREIEMSAPKFDDLKTKVWAELTDPQRTAVEARLAEFRERQAKQREDEYVKRRAGKNGGPPAAPGAAAPGPERGPGAPLTAERRDRLIRLFEHLSPQEQDQLLERIEQRMKERPGPGRPDGVAKPPPGLDQVRVPKPEEPATPPSKPAKKDR